MVPKAISCPQTSLALHACTHINPNTEMEHSNTAFSGSVQIVLVALNRFKVHIVFSGGRDLSLLHEKRRNPFPNIPCLHPMVPTHKMLLYTSWWTVYCMKWGTTHTNKYCIAGYFHGMLIFVIFLVNKIFCTCSNLDQQRIVVALFHYLCPIDSVISTQRSSFSSCPACDGWGSEQQTVETTSTTNRKQGQHSTSSQLGRA